MADEKQGSRVFQTVRAILEAYAPKLDQRAPRDEWAEDLVRSFRERLFGSCDDDGRANRRRWDDYGSAAGS